MHKIPIFDSLTHPTLNGKWLDNSHHKKCTIETLKKSMKSENIKWAFAVGMGKTFGAYDEEKYSTHIIAKSPNIFPIAFLEINELKKFSNGNLTKYFCNLKMKGYVGVKLHPRIGKFTYEDEFIIKIINSASRENLAVFLCTYLWSSLRVKTYVGTNLIIDLLRETQSAKIILLHGGVIKLLEYAEICRAFPNLLLDLSFTICKYKGSSIDIDIQYLFKNFDQRICIGSDFPEYSMQDLRNSFNFFSKKLDKKKAENIAFRNIFNFVPLINLNE